MGVIDKVANVLDQAWHWISLLWNKGPGAVWEEIKGQLADLGTAVMSGIAAWIGEDLIKIAIAKIAKLSNPAGAIIELIQTIAKTIDFVVTKMNRILAMADAVLNSIGAIVAGNIGPAAAAVEKALVGAIGTVLAFIAEWLGISDPGMKLKGIVEKVQGKVEAGIDWLIAKALAAIKKLFGKDDKKDPVSKNPKWDAAVAAINTELGTMERTSPDKKLAKEQIDARLPQWKATYGFTNLRVQRKDTNYDIFGAMSPEALVAAAPAKGPVLSTPPQYGAVDPSRGGTRMTIERLTPYRDVGSGTSPLGGAPDKVVGERLKRTTGETRLYVLGHLLSQKLGGTGVPGNLTPITISANALHESRVESTLKTAIPRKSPGPTADPSDRIFHYSVDARAPAGAPPSPADVAKGVIPEEAQLASSFDCLWQELMPSPDDPNKFIPKPGGEQGTEFVQNVPPWPKT
jgi:hypothetical protein